MKREIVLLHITVFVMSLSGLFLKKIMMPEVLIVVFRTLGAAIFLGGYLKVKKIKMELFSRRRIKGALVPGVIMAVYCFMYIMSMKTTTIAIALISFSIYPLFTTFFEALFEKKKIDSINLKLSLVIITGIAIATPLEIGGGDGVVLGATYGILGGAFYSLLSIINKKKMEIFSSEEVAFNQVLGAFIVSLPALFLEGNIDKINLQSVAATLIYGAVFSGVVYITWMYSLNRVKASTVGVISSLGLVHGIVVGFLFLDEIPEIRSIVGSLIIVLAIGGGRGYLERSRGKKVKVT